MATTLTATVGNTTYDLSNRIDYLHLGNDGFGLPPVTRLEEQGVQQDGSSDLGFRLEPRPIQLVLMIRGETESEYWTLRRQIGNIFKPRNTAITLQFTTGAGDTYAIDAHYRNGLTLNSNDKTVLAHKMAITLVANDPLFYNPTQQVYTYSVGATLGSGFYFPLSFPVNFGSSVVNTTQVVSYDGDYATSPVIQIYGPITNPVITNQTTGIVLDLTGTTIADGDYYTIDTRYGNTSVTNSSGTNKIDTLVGNSNLSGFKLIADPDSINGANTITVTGTGANTHTVVYLRYYERYLIV